MRSRSRSKQVRQGSGSSGRARWPAPSARVAPGGQPGLLDRFPGPAVEPGWGPPCPSPAAAVGVGVGDPRPPWPAMVEAQRRFRSSLPWPVGLRPVARPSPGLSAGLRRWLVPCRPVCTMAVTGAAAPRTLYRQGTGPAARPEPR